MLQDGCGPAYQNPTNQFRLHSNPNKIDGLCLKYKKHQTDTSERPRSTQRSTAGGRGAGLEFRGRKGAWLQVPVYI